MNTHPTFQSNLPNQKELVAIRRKARALQAAHMKAVFGRIVAAIVGRDSNDGIQATAPQHS